MRQDDECSLVLCQPRHNNAPVSDRLGRQKRGGNSNDKTSLLTTSTPAGLSTSQDWLQVGQSYSSISNNHGVAGDESDQGSKASKQNRYPLPPKDKAQVTKAVLDESRSSRMPLQTVARRHKAVDEIGREDSSPSADDSIPESKLASASESESEVAESGKKRRRRSYSSDGSPNNTKSGLDRKTKHAKTNRQERRKVKERRKRKTSRISRKSERKSRHRSDSRRHGSRSRKETGSSSSDGDFGERNLDGPPAAVRRSKSRSRHYQDQLKLFVEDRHGDQDNISFEGFYRTDVPIYHGMKNFARKEGVRRAGEKGRAPLVRYFSRQARDLISDERVARVQLWRGIKRQRHRSALETNTADAGGGKGTPTEGGYSSMSPSAILPLQGNHDLSVRSRSQEQSPGADFLPVDPTVMAVSPSNEDTSTLEGGDPAHTLDVGAPTENLEQWVTRRTKEFNRLTRKQPKSENLWLKFADFQEEAVRAIQGGGEFVRSPSSAVVHTTLEKRASVLEGALRRNPTSVKLRKAQLHVAGQLYEHDAVDSLWQKAIEKSNNSLALWLRYLDFKAGHFASFSVEKQRSTFSLCIEALECRRREARQAREKDEKARGVFIMGDRSMLEDGREHARAEKELLDVLWSYCVMERAAGYHERALGALQAMVELNITSRDKSVSVDDLEAFWESEFPRIGDAHPSVAGISQWREASLARNDSRNNRSRQDATSSSSSASIVQVPSGERAAVGRKLPVVKALDARGRRKRAVDFFSEDAAATGVPTPRGQGERHTPLWRMQTGLSNPSKADSNERVGVTYVADVLEKAYQAAEALSSKTTAFQSADGDLASSPLSKDASRDFDTDGRDAPDRAPLESVVESENRLVGEETLNDSGGLSISSISSISSKTRNTRERQMKQEMGQDPIEPTMQSEPVPQGKPGPASQDEARDERRGGNDGDGGHGARAVEAEGLIWVDESQATAYSVRHGYRINVQGAQDSVSGLEYGRILSQVRGDAKDDRGGNATTAAARERIRYEEMAKEATVQEDMLEDVPESDPFSSWATSEDRMTREQWQPLRATVDEDGAAEQPDRVVFVEDIRPFLSTLSHPSSLGTLVDMLVSVGGLVFPRSDVSHSHKFMLEACGAASLGDGGLAGSLISAVSDGLQAVWKASGAELPVSGRSVVRCTGRPGSLPPPVVCTTADQFLLLTDELVGDVSRQKFIRNVLHHLIRTPQPSPGSTNSSGIWSDCGDMLVQLQCTLVLFEGYLASAAGAYSGHYGRAGAPGETSIGSKGGKVLADNESYEYGHEARKVAKSLLEASQASATDLRLWSSYVQLLAILGNRDEAIKVAEKALSLVEALPENKKSLSAEMFWVAFRLHAGLPLTPRDPHAGEEIPSNGTGLELLANLFDRDETRNGKRQMALLLLCSFAEGRFDRPKKSKKLKRDDKGPVDGVISPPRLMTARKLMADRVARLAAQLPREGKTDGVSSLPQCHSLLDMTPLFMYHSVAWVWMEYLSRGPDEAEYAMAECLAMVKVKTNATNATQTNDSVDDDHSPGSRRLELRGAVSGNKPYEWDVVPDGTTLGVCLERMHRSFSELVMLAQRFDPVKTGPRQVRMVLLRGLQSCPAEPGMLCMLLATEQFSGSQQRLVHHLSEVARRRALDWEQGPTSFEWILNATHQVMRCVHEARHVFVAPEAEMEKGGSALNESTRSTIREEVKGGRDRAHCVNKWLPGSYARLRRSMEKAVTHATGRQMALLWRMYMSLEAMRGNHKQAKHLFWRAIHACPGNKALWMDSLRGDQRARIGSLGLRPAFRAKELQEISGVMLEKSLHVRAEPV